MSLENDIQASVRSSKKFGLVFSSLVVFIIILVLLGLSFIISVRPLSFGPDTQEYYFFFNAIVNNKPLRIDEVGFIFFAKLISLFSSDYAVFFFCVSFLSLLFTVLVLSEFRILAKLNRFNFSIFCLVVFGVYFLSPFFFSGQINIIRHYLSLPLLVLCLLKFKDQKFLSLMCLTIASLIHISNILYLPIVFFMLLPRKYIYKFFAILFITYVSGLSLFLFDFLSSFIFPGALEVLTSSPDYQSGIRFDFALFNLFIFLMISMLKNDNLRYELLRLFTILSIPFCLIGYIDFSDRLLAPIFYLIPIVTGFLICSVKLNASIKFLLSVIIFTASLIILISKFHYFI